MKYKALIFDMDGTLLDTLTGVIKACNESFKEYGFDVRFTNDDGKYFIGAGSFEFAKRALARAKIDEVNLLEYSKVFLKNYEIYQKIDTKPFPGLNILLNDLKDKGYIIGICSNKPQDLLNKISFQMFPDVEFDLILGQSPNVPCKPSPMMFEIVKQKLNLGNEEILYIGDSQYDYEFAKNSNGDCCIVTYGYGIYEDDFMNHVKYKANSVQDLRDLFLNKLL